MIRLPAVRCGNLESMAVPTTTDYLQAIEHVPSGATLILVGVGWEDYEQLLSDLDLGGGYPGIRVTYDEGRLEIMSPSSAHEMYKDLILHLGKVIADELGCDLETRGSTTFKLKSLAKGAEPDTCFYVRHAARMIGKHIIDLSTDPPPDIVVEIDVSHESRTKLAIYARFRVPEV